MCSLVSFIDKQKKRLEGQGSMSVKSYCYSKDLSVRSAKPQSWNYGKNTQKLPNPPPLGWGPINTKKIRKNAILIFFRVSGLRGLACFVRARRNRKARCGKNVFQNLCSCAFDVYQARLLEVTQPEPGSL